MTPPRYDPLDGPPDPRAPAGGGERTGWRARQRHGIRSEAIGMTDAFAAQSSGTSSAEFREVGMYGGPLDGTAHVVPVRLIDEARRRHRDRLTRPLTIPVYLPIKSSLNLDHIPQSRRRHATYRLEHDGSIPRLVYVDTAPLRR